uniref:Uncharacterized protein n=1 Tax=Rhizophora mucronata TaxID=61149 RepID=A0A2P2QI41_RHIMU
MGKTKSQYQLIHKCSHLEN